MKVNNIKNILLALIPPAIIIIAWFYATNYGNTPSAILPKISSVGKAFVANIQSGQLQDDLKESLGSVIKGYLTATLIGIVVGSLMGMSQTIKTILQPTITCIRSIPMIAWMPMIILWCGIGQISKVMLIVIAATFPILVNTQGGMEGTPDGLVEVAKLYKLNGFEKFVRVYLPHALPQILVGLKLGLSVSWMAVVGAELIASTAGIGYRLSNARSMMQSSVLIVCMIVVGVIGIFMDKILGAVFNALTPWEKANNKH
ncbi:MAG: ABC transporter permease [Lachnospiraceae bacterium]|nr:ABC transporter permease [Lachnospiraceae bacterium]